MRKKMTEMITLNSNAREQAIAQWRAMRVGLFIHWSPSSGRALAQSHSHARFSKHNLHGSVPAEVYDEFYKDFNPTQYNPEIWLKLAYDAGMRYAVFVAKHHDGFCMWNSLVCNYNIMATPYGKDVAAMFAEACRQKGLALGWQISPKDWKHPDFGTSDHDRYNAFYESILSELATQYGPLAVMWYDGIDPVGPELWKDTPECTAAMLRDHNPGIMLSNHGGCVQDFTCFELMVGPFDREHPWEMCEAINPSGWVFNQPMPPFKLRDLLRNLIYTVARDGNYLLDIGPMPNGQFYPPDAERLGELADWMRINGEGIHGTRGGPYRDGDWGGATCKDNAVYLFFSDRVGNHLTLPALPANVLSAHRLDGGPLEWKIDGAFLCIELPDRDEKERPLFVGVKVVIDCPAFELPVMDGQPNLAEKALITVSSIRDGAQESWGVKNLFDNQGYTVWDSDPSEQVSRLDIDLGEVQWVGSAAIAQRSVPDGYNAWFTLELILSVDEDSGWQTIVRQYSSLGRPPILEFAPVQARFVRLEIAKTGRQQPIQVAEFRLFAPLG
jgi:alpha-L-fucosidase